MRVTQDQSKDFKNVARQFPVFTEFLNAWRTEELERIPYAKDPQSLDVLRGRVQALTEMQRLLDPSV